MKDQAIVDIGHESGVVVASVAGEVDLTNVAFVRQRILDAVDSRGRGLVLELTALRYLDSAGIRMLFDVHGTLAAHRQHLRLVAAPGAAVTTLLRLAGVSAALPVEPTLADAVAGIAAGR